MPIFNKKIFILFLVVFGLLFGLSHSIYGQSNKAVSGAGAPAATSGDILLHENISLNFCFNELTGNDSIQFSVLNAGLDSINRVKFYWISDGVVQGPYLFEELLLPGEDSEVSIGGFQFNAPGNYYLTFWGVLDGMNTTNPQNDTVNVSVQVHATQQPAPISDIHKCLNDSAEIVAQSGYVDYKWGNNSNSQVIVANEPGDYIVTLTDANGCKVSDTVHVENHPYPNVILGNDTSICDGDILTIEAPIGFTDYLWSGTSSHSNAIQVSSQGMYQLSLKDSNNCTYQDEIEVAVNAVPVVNLQSEISVCDGMDAILNANDGTPTSSYLWNSGSFDPVINTANPGIYTVTVTDVNSCSSVASTEVKILPLPTPVINSDTVLCNGESQTLGVYTMPYQAFEWSTNETTPTIVTNSGGVYTLTVTDANNCEGITSIKLVEKNVSLNLGDDITICEHDFFTIQPLEQYESYVWNDNSVNDYLPISSGGTYTLKVSKFGNCFASDTIEVIEIPAPVADFTFHADLNDWRKIIFENTSNVVDSVKWQFGDGTISNDLDVSYIYPIAGNYTVSLTVYNECGFNKFSSTVPVGITTIETINRFSEVKLFPNPVRDNLSINIVADNIDYLDLTLQNELGQVVKKWNSLVQSNRHTEIVDLSSLAKGVYFISISSGDIYHIEKLIIH